MESHLRDRYKWYEMIHGQHFLNKFLSNFVVILAPDIGIGQDSVTFFISVKFIWLAEA